MAHEMEQATVEAAGNTRLLGSRLARKVVAGRGGPAMRAVVIVGRPNVILELPSMNMYWPIGWFKKRRLERRLGNRPWQSQELPDYMGLVLDGLGSLHLLALQRGDRILAEVKEELRQWPIGDVKVTITSDSGWWRVIEISDGAAAYIVLAAFVLPSQRAAMKLIAESSGGV